jgi:hypothetical protein
MILKEEDFLNVVLDTFLIYSVLYSNNLGHI